ncbi:unnamed protein product [Aphanomyces euteiches]|uniref:Maleylacetoacetate isomerase n=1 Tax=Aphanomyces euteiches TaxID=100861 RepID=A0A6G0WZR9_9STRA|nr:hypothetical protein Ae201684_009847 [Aphanomyces euteiches]KAH9095831.1 hypothetical protein Ae201684P_010042 [Aphanomyces euteiches]
MARPILYAMGRSSCSWRVRAVLAWKGIKYESRVVNAFANDNKTEEYRKMNPNQKIPALAIDGHVLTQSIAILEYLEETRPERPLLPKDPAKRAAVRAFVDIIGADIQPIQSLSVMREISKDAAPEDQAKVTQAWCSKWIARGFEALESLLQETSGKYCFGDELTLADIYRLPQVTNARYFSMDLSVYPTLERIANTLSKEDIFLSTHPSTINDGSS